MKVKSEHENDMLIKCFKELNDVLSVLVGIDLSLTLSNDNELSNNKEIHKAYVEISLLIKEIESKLPKGFKDSLWEELASLIVLFYSKTFNALVSR